MRLSRFCSVIAAAVVASVSASAMATIYTDEPSFTSAISPVHYLEDFGDFVFGTPLDGSVATWTAPGGGGFGWSAFAAEGLWSNDEALSTSVSFDPIVITYSGNPVTAIGGNFTATDIAGGVVNGTVTINLSDGTSASIVDQSAGSFWGYTSTVPIVSATFSVADTGADDLWLQIDHLYTGVTVPEPATASLAPIVAAALAIRRRRA